MEEGEINDSDDGYTQVKRPDLVVHSQHQQLDVYSGNSSENEEVSDSESSDSEIFKTKRPKVKLKRLPKLDGKPSNELQTNPKKKWDVWCAPVQEQILAETLGSFAVDPLKSDRSVESYNYDVSRWHYKDNQRSNSPISRLSDDINDDYFIDEKKSENKVKIKRKSVKERLGHKTKSKSSHKLEKLTVTSDSQIEDVAKSIADGLMEEKIHLVTKVVELFGQKRSLELYYQTRRIEADGGMMVLNQSRRRTPGGVFFKLVATDDEVDKTKIQEILRTDHKEQSYKRKKLIARKRRDKTKAVKEELISSGLLNNDLSDMLIKTEIKEEDCKSDLSDTSLIVQVGISEEPEEIKDEIEVTLTNPPPSPATDQDTPPPQQEREFLADEDDGDYLEIETEMEFL